MSNIERPRKMELLHTPKLELTRQMRQNSLNIDEIVFMVASNKINASDIRIHAPTICDKILNNTLRQLMSAGVNDQPQQQKAQGKMAESADRRGVPHVVA